MLRHHRRIALAALVAAGAVTPLTLPATASAAPAKYADDFNGDGYRDLATAAPSATVAGKTYAGAVVVNYGSASGVSASRRTVVTENTANVPGTAEKDDQFGSALASGDLNRDGYADLVIGAEREDAGSDVDGGAVVIVWGGKNGLSGGTSVPDPAPSAHDFYGKSLAVADFTGDGRADLAVGSAGKGIWVHRGGFTKTSGAASRYQLVTALQSGGRLYGAQSLAAGDIDGDGTADLAVSGSYHPDASTYEDGTLIYLGSSSGLAFQTVLKNKAWELAVVGDLNRDGYADVVTSAPPGAVRQGDGGSVSAYLGSANGVRTQPQATLTQDSPGVPGGDEESDWFGHALSVDDVNGDGYADVAVGAIFEDVGAAELTGNVTVLRGSAAGLTGTGAQSFNQATAGVPGTAEDTDRFGASVRLADLNGDRRADLSVGADGEDAGDGAYWVLRGSSAGVTTTKAVSFGPSSAGMSTSGYPRLGATMLK